MYDLVVLGGGSGGLNVAAMAARVGARVALVEKHQLGGECTHTACVPSKALIHAARLVQDIRSAGSYGIQVGEPKVDFSAVMGRVRSVVGGFSADETAEVLGEKGIEVLFGSPAFEAYDTVLVDGQTRLASHKFVIATGSSPAVPPILGLDAAGYLDNVSFWNLTELPESITVVGAGPVGIELAQALARFGSQVTVVSESDRVLPREDPEVSAFVQSTLESEGITFRLGTKVEEVKVEGGRKVCLTSGAGGPSGQVAAAEILIATGRTPNLAGLNLEAAGIHADPDHGIEVDAYLQTSNPRVYAIGDVIGHHLWTHAAEREAAVAFQNAIIRLPKKVDYAAMPWATFVAPEVATVGQLEHEARESNPDCRVFRVDLAAVDRARIDGLTHGFAKVVATPSGRILGATIVGENAAAVLQEFVVAMEHGIALGDLAATVHIYPTYTGLARSLANQFAATRLEGGFVRRALRWFYGFDPRGGAAEPAAAEPVAAVSGNGDGHGNGNGHGHGH